MRKVILLFEDVYSLKLLTSKTVNNNNIKNTEGKDKSECPAFLNILISCLYISYSYYY